MHLDALVALMVFMADEFFIPRPTIPHCHLTTPPATHAYPSLRSTSAGGGARRITQAMPSNPSKAQHPCSLTIHAPDTAVASPAALTHG